MIVLPEKGTRLACSHRPVTGLEKVKATPSVQKSNLHYHKYSLCVGFNLELPEIFQWNKLFVETHLLWLPDFIKDDWEQRSLTTTTVLDHVTTGKLPTGELDILVQTSLKAVQNRGGPVVGRSSSARLWGRVWLFKPWTRRSGLMFNSLNSRWHGERCCNPAAASRSKDGGVCVAAQEPDVFTSSCR